MHRLIKQAAIWISIIAGILTIVTFFSPPKLEIDPTKTMEDDTPSTNGRIINKLVNNPLNRSHRCVERSVRNSLTGYEGKSDYIIQKWSNSSSKWEYDKDFPQYAKLQDCKDAVALYNQ